ncbi:hypothetical protein B5S28_g3091 [[Candida] boidinii]|nr:hypothetical protein B5S28_g3091 [[Candida] boidinii]OWB62951.1 hypothetical protein B5S29_g3902 [[Candida] boidinii]OWB73751.1 hypothetical protein B5S31_g3511 [[Candida] boidinii]GMF06601.1 unnamed protein product [[Candida] boidinii]
MKLTSILPIIVSTLLLSKEACAGEWVKYSHGDYVFMGCAGSVQKYAQYCETVGKTYKCLCKSKPEIASVLDCIYNKDEEDMNAAIDSFITHCEDFNKTYTPEKFEKIYNNYTDSFVDLSVDKDFNATEVTTSPVKGGKIAKTAIQFQNAYNRRWGNITKAHYLGMGALLYWGVLMLVCSIANWTSFLAPSFTKKFNGKISNGYRKFITLPPLYKRRHTEPLNYFGMSGFLPTRFESIVIFVFFVYCFLSTAILGYTWQTGDQVFKTHEAGVSRYVGDRSAIIVSYIFPLLFIFAGRNNFLQWITRWKQSTFVTYHKWLARICCLLIFVHAVAMACQTQGLGKWHSRLATYWYRWGIVGILCFWLSAAVASYTIRKHLYEVFVITHIIFVAIGLAAAWIHSRSQLYEQFYIACAAVWCFDRFVRIVRLCYFGIRTAHATVLEEGTIKVSIPYHKHFTPFPGAHGYVHFLTPANFWQSHPFTFIYNKEDTEHLHFYIKAKKGVTKRIHDAIIKNGGSHQIKVMLEGPYGNRNGYERYDKALLIAGGNGIPGIYSHAISMIQNNVKTEVKLIWVIREYRILNWFKNELAHFKGTKCRPIVYVTRPDSPININPNLSSTDSESNEKETSENEKSLSMSIDELKEAFDFIDFRTGRVDIDQLISEELQDTTGTVSVGVCGNPNMVDHVRSAVAEKIDTCPYRVDYFEELQVW